MHQSVLDFGQAALGAREVTGKRVIEVGSLNVNGSLRPHVMSLHPAEYIGIDVQLGAGVDYCCDVRDPALLRAAPFGLIVCTEMLEHAQDWRAAIHSMKALLDPGGVILLTTRSIGFARHYEHPGDFWRFSVEDMARIFAEFQIESLISDPGGSGGGPGVFLKAMKPEDFHERALDAISVYSMEYEA